MTPLARIAERVFRNGDVNDPTTPRPLLTLEEFFEGNECPGSIGCNLIPTPEPAEFRQLLQQVRARPEVGDVRIQITMFDDPEGWPFCDTVWIMTTANAEEVAGWFAEEIRPDECSSGWDPETVYEPYSAPAGMLPVSCWWD